MNTRKILDYIINPNNRYSKQMRIALEEVMIATKGKEMNQAEKDRMTLAQNRVKRAR